MSSLSRLARSRLVAVAVALGAALAPGPAAAEDTWSDPYTGVRHLSRTTSRPWRIHALVVDLCAPGVSVRATKSGEREQTVPSFAGDVGAEAAINGDFFSYEDYSTSGLAMGDGAAWSDTADGSGSGFVAFGRSLAMFSPPAEVFDDPPAGAREIVSGHPLIVRDGVAIHEYSCTSHYCERHPRTAVGFSRDLRTLYLAVVDGRSSSSVGMTLSELADLMVDLGAWSALNFDGGGSTTMWLRGSGVLNDPSDGSPRVVGNHLAIQATGSGPPGSCAVTGETEVTLQPDVLSAGATTDVDGDGLADACARAAAGVLCALSDAAGSGPTTRIDGPALADDTGWADITNYATMRWGDVTGDGLADLCARANAGVRCWPSIGTGFDESIVGPALSDDAGWDDPRYFSTLRLADANGDGLDDVCARSADGFGCWPATGTGFGDRTGVAGLTDEAGWGNPRFYGTIRMGDVSGDGLADVCARASAGVYCWISDGAGFPTRIDGPAWSDAAGWSHVSTWSTIRMADLDGDGAADLCGRSTAGVRCHLSRGDGFGPELVGPALTDDSGWSDHSNYSTLRAGDVDGDGAADLCARANAGVWCWLWTGDGFATRLDGPPLSDDSGWNQERYFRTIRLADVTGDGRADLCARHSGGFRCWLSDGAGFPTTVDGPEWSNASGWARQQYYTTIAVAGPRPACVAVEEVCNGVDDDCDGQIDESGCAADADADADVDADADADGDGDADADGDEDAGSDGDADAGAPDRLAGGCGCAAPGPGRVRPRALARLLGG